MGGFVGMKPRQAGGARVPDLAAGQPGFLDNLKGAVPGVTPPPNPITGMTPASPPSATGGMADVRPPVMGVSPMRTAGNMGPMGSAMGKAAGAGGRGTLGPNMDAMQASRDRQAGFARPQYGGGGRTAGGPFMNYYRQRMPRLF